MSKNIANIPFTELVERVQELSRERAQVKGKIRGIINDVYVREFPRKEDWNFFLTSSTLTVNKKVADGTVSATTGGSTATFSGVTMGSSYTGYQLKISGNSYIYDVTFAGTTSLNISPVLSGDQNASSTSYNLFKSKYSLAENFDRFPKNGGLINYRGGKEEIIPEKPFQEWGDDYSSTPSNDAKFCRIIGTDTAGNALLEINPPSAIDKSYRYDYFLRPKPLRETTAGTVSISANGTSVTGDGSTLFTQATTGDYFRIDDFGTGSDSEWYPIIAISGNSSLTLGVSFGQSSATSARYTISSSPQMPSKMHPALLYGAILQVVSDQDDPQVSGYKLILAEVLSDGKRLYKTRNYNQDIHHIGEEWMYRR
jgi:hypothetical protein